MIHPNLMPRIARATSWQKKEKISKRCNSDVVFVEFTLNTPKYKRKLRAGDTQQMRGEGIQYSTSDIKSAPGCLIRPRRYGKLNTCTAFFSSQQTSSEFQSQSPRSFRQSDDPGSVIKLRASDGDQYGLESFRIVTILTYGRQSIHKLGIPVHDTRLQGGRRHRLQPQS